MKKIKEAVLKTLGIIAGGLVIAGVVFLVSKAPLYAGALNTDESYQGGQYHLNANGVKVFTLQYTGGRPENEGANAVGFYSIAGSTYAVIFATGGWSSFGDEVDPGGFSSAQIILKVPHRAGGLIFNTTLGQTCMSTGTAAGQWAVLGSSGAPANKNNGLFYPCQ